MSYLLSRDELRMTVIRLLWGASESIFLHARRVDQPDFGLPLEDLGNSIDNRLELLCLLPLLGIRRERDGSLSKEAVSPALLNALHSAQQAFLGAGWYARLVPDGTSLSASLIIDSSAVIYFEYLNEVPGPFFSKEPSDVEHYRSAFENQWKQSFDTSALETLYTREAALAAPDNAIAVVSNETWSELISRLSRSPQLLHSLDPRRFEELIAELLAREGLEPHLTPATRDGGRDILAFHDTPVGRHLYLVECKRFRQDRPVDVKVVRQLYGVVAAERATAGLLVTTSRFTKDALQFASGIEHQMGLKDYEALKSWLRARQ